MTSIFGPIVTADQVEQGVADTLRNWFPDYLRQLELEKGLDRGVLMTPRGFLIAEELDTDAGIVPPAIVVISPGFARRPERDEDTYRAFWSMAVGVIVSADTRAHTKRLVRWYAAVARSIMLHKSGDYSDGVQFIDEDYDDRLPFGDDQTISGGTLVFTVEVGEIANRWGGPAVYSQPPPAPDEDSDPGSVWPTAATVTVAVTMKEEA